MEIGMKDTKKSLLRAFSLLIICALLMQLMGCKSRPSAQLRRQCEGVVEDYFEYIKKAKHDRLSRYIDRDDDPFQQMEDSENTQIFELFEKTLTYEIDESSFDGEDAVFKVYVTVRDGADVARSLNSAPTLTDVQNAIDKISATVSKTIELDLSFNKKLKSYMLDSTEEIYKFIDRQASKIYGKITYTGPDDCKAQVDELIKAFTNFDLTYLEYHTNLDLDDDYEPKYMMDLYRAEMATLQHSYTITSIDEEKAVILLHLEKNDGEEVLEKIVNDEEVISKLLSKYVVEVAEGKDFSTSNDILAYFDFSGIVDDFKTELNNSTKIKIDVSCTITNNGQDGTGFEFERDLDSLFPVPNCLDLVDDSIDDKQYEIYLRASEIAYEAGKMTKEQYDLLVRTFSPYPLSDEEVKTILAKYGYALDSYTDTTKGDMDFESENAMASFDKFDGFESAYEDYMEQVRDLKEQIRSGEIAGKVEGVPLDLWIDASMQDLKIKLYTCVIQDRMISFSIMNPTDQDVEKWKEMLRELKLIA